MCLTGRIDGRVVYNRSEKLPQRSLSAKNYPRGHFQRKTTPEVTFSEKLPQMSLSPPKGGTMNQETRRTKN